jgi:hypothetical protein
MTNLMQGFPPAPADQVTLANWRKAPHNRWAFQHVRELVPSADIANDPGAVRALPPAPVDLTGVRVPDGRFLCRAAWRSIKPPPITSSVPEAPRRCKPRRPSS